MAGQGRHGSAVASRGWIPGLRKGMDQVTPWPNHSRRRGPGSQPRVARRSTHLWVFSNPCSGGSTAIMGSRLSAEREGLQYPISPVRDCPATVCGYMFHQREVAGSTPAFAIFARRTSSTVERTLTFGRKVDPRRFVGQCFSGLGRRGLAGRGRARQGEVRRGVSRLRAVWHGRHGSER